ncbi:MAG: zinc-binding alcohol dehydrogenase [Deltaproteobacteria bacterium]|jgi:2-desacetyl-2-hydroxyethyl bacteriochlorophyllide A dehydrogenase|nr:zinc-binding alcohol dehydrogenase [Deltaproteobacteria bacterium]MBT6433759.1 zinc-binding alcohol dehydrogenase [Deltaproteobacteria bacterium]MBT6491776.1 zinc-binding alcohol dehydrogenase [Deltaproteobacteria bacterium]
MELSTQVLQHVQRKQVEVTTVSLPALGPSDILARATCSGVSPGTEALVFNGNIEPGTALDESIPALKDGSLQYPFAYGYCWVGRVVKAGDNVTNLKPGDRIFTFAPHQAHIVTAADACIALPDNLSDSAATLLPSMETAVSIVHDTQPLLGENIRIFGQGVVGLLTAWILNQFPLTSLSTVDPSHPRRSISQALGLNAFNLPTSSEKLSPVDATIEISGNPAALDQAIQSTQAHGRVIIASWYGSQKAELSLNTHFHRGRIQIISTQVSSISPKLRGGWNNPRRLEQAMRLLHKFPHAALSATPMAFEDAPTSYPALFTEVGPSIHPFFVYPKD